MAAFATIAQFLVLVCMHYTVKYVPGAVHVPSVEIAQFASIGALLVVKLPWTNPDAGWYPVKVDLKVAVMFGVLSAGFAGALVPVISQLETMRFHIGLLTALVVLFSATCAGYGAHIFLVKNPVYKDIPLPSSWRGFLFLAACFGVSGAALFTYSVSADLFYVSLVQAAGVVFVYCLATALDRQIDWFRAQVRSGLSS